MEHNKSYLVITFDGGARNNPGKSGCGAIVSKIIENDNNKNIIRIYGIISIYLGMKTNNYSEYKGISEGLQLLMEIFEENNHILVIGDSQMILTILQNVKMTKKYQKEQEKIYHVLQFQEEVNYKHHLRNYNKAADYLANLAMDRENKKNMIQQDVNIEKLKDLLHKDLKEDLNVESIEINEKIIYRENSREDRLGERLIG